MQFSLFLLAFGLAFLLPYAQVLRLIDRGTDHRLHLFLAAVIRENGHRLFVRVPRLLNDSYCGTYPLFLHWFLSFLDERQTRTASLFINPLANALSVLAVYLFLQQDPSLASNSGWICLSFALTPQFLHFSNSRLWGLSSRPIGLTLFLFFALLAELAAGTDRPWLFLTLAVLAGYLIWGFNTFAQQSLVFFSILRALIFNSWWMLAAAALSLGVFVALHPRYAPGYLKHSVLYIRSYATDLADRFILQYRFSIWRDFVHDIWKRLSQRWDLGLHYMYTNALLIVILLNPLTAVTLLSRLPLPGRGEADPSQIVSSSAEMTSIAVLVFLATSFRATRFLGEPERYVEMATAFSAIAGVTALSFHFGQPAVIATVACFAVADLVQVVANSRFAAQGSGDPELQSVRKAIDRELGDEPVRFASNSENVSRYMMTAPYSFARMWSIEEGFGGLSTAEALSVYPYVIKEALEAVVREHRINALVLDKSRYSSIFEDGDDRHRLQQVTETEEYRVFRLDWGSAS